MNDMKKRSLTINWFLTMSSKIFVLLVPLITTPYVSRVLGAEGLGIYTYCLSYSSLFIVLGQMGIPLYGKRTIAIYQNDEKKQNQVFNELLFLQQIMLVISCIVYFIVAKCIGIYWWMFMACSVGHLAAFFNISWFFEGIEDFKTVVVKGFGIKIISVIAIFIFVREKEDLYIYALCLFIAQALGEIILWKNAFKHVRYKIPKLRNVIKHLRPAFLLLLPYAVTQLFELIDKSMVGILCSDISEVAYYEQARKITSLSISLIISVGVVIMPRLALYFHENEKERLKKYMCNAVDVTLLLSIAIAFGCAAVASNLVPWFFGTGFEKVETILVVSAPLLVLMGVSNLLGTQVLTATKKEALLLKVNVVSILINVIFNAVLIPQYLSIGAMVATVIAEFIKCIILIINVKEIIELRKVVLQVIGYCILGLIMFLGVTWFGENVFIEATIQNTIGLIIIGTIVYGMLLIITRNPWVKYIWNKIGGVIKR